MSTGSISLDILLNKILTDAISGGNESIRAIQKRYPSFSEKEAHEILAMVSATAQSNDDSAELVVTAPPSFALKTKPTKVTVREMLMGARKSILITGYSLSDYFAELVDCVIQKSQEGVLVKFFVNDIESQKAFDRLCCYKGKFLRIYNYPKQEDNPDFNNEICLAVVKGRFKKNPSTVEYKVINDTVLYMKEMNK